MTFAHRFAALAAPLAMLLAGVLLGGTPRIAHAQTAASDPRLGRLDPGVRAAVVAIIDSARASGLPVEPLVDKALEGMSKGAPGPRIIVAVRGLAGKLGIARLRIDIG